MERRLATWTISNAGAGLDDSRIWRRDNTCVYFAKNSYKWLLSDPTYQREDSTQTINQKKSYNILWNLKVASKTKIAVWRIIHSYIPTLSNLQSIKLPVVDICPFCKSEKESVSHIFWECTTARDTLQGVGIDGSISPQGQQWKNWLANLFSCMNEEKCTRLVITLWAIWNQRNKTYHQGERQNIARLTSFIKAYEAESSLLDSSTSRNMNQQNATWQPPRPNEVKGNFDAAYNKTLQDFVTEIIFRDYEGFILAACTYQNHFVADATTAEAIVCLQTVPVAEELGFRDLAIEGDSFTVVLSEGRRTTRRMLWLRKGNNGRSQGFGSKKPFQKPQ